MKKISSNIFYTIMIKRDVKYFNKIPNFHIHLVKMLKEIEMFVKDIQVITIVDGI